MFFRTKCVPERRWSTCAVRRVRDGLVCGRIILGSCSDRFRIVNGVSPLFRAFAVDRIPLWFATLGSFPRLQVVLVEELPMEFWRKSRTKCVFESCYVNAKFTFPASCFECAVSSGLEVSDFVFSVRHGFAFHCCFSLCGFTCVFHYFSAVSWTCFPCVSDLFQQGCSKQFSLLMVWWQNRNLLTTPLNPGFSPKVPESRIFGVW